MTVGNDSYRRCRTREIIRAWKAAGVREEVWKGQSSHAFRKGFKTGLLVTNANADAVDFLQGHTLGSSARNHYIDATLLPLRETVAAVPRIGGSDNVVELPVTGRSR